MSEEVRLWRSVRLAGWTEYEASDTGHIRNTNTGRVLNPKSGLYLKVIKLVGRDEQGRRKFNGIRVHRLVASAWLGPCPADHVVDHKDNDRHNNSPFNLRYVVQKENIRKAVRQDRMGRKLTVETVLAIRAAYQGRRTEFRNLGERFGVTRQNIAQIIDRKIWKEV